MRDLLPHLNLSGWYASPTVILLVCFIAVVWWVVRRDDKAIQEAAALPLEDENQEYKTDGQERRRAS